MHKALCLFVFVGVVSCNAPSPNKPNIKAGHVPSAKSSQNSAGVLQKNVLYISGSVPTPCAPVEYYYVTKDHKLLRKDQGQDPVNIASDVNLAFTGWDDALWYLDVNEKVFRLDYNDSSPVEVPGPEGVELTALAPVNYGETYAVSKDGDIYHFIANAWFKLDSTTGPKTGVSVGNDGVLLASDRNSSHIWIFNYGTQNWDDYEQQGVDADIDDVDHVVVVKDLENSVSKRVDGKWVDVREKCRSVSAFDENAFYCTTPEGDAKLVKY